MKFFIDTASLKDIQEAQDLGILDGVTTNPFVNGQRRYFWQKQRYASL